MSERPRENSVLFSLRELRRIEDDRVKKEQETARAKAEGERQAKENAERAAREAEERRVREEQDRLRREQEEEQDRHREGNLRLQEAERRARVEGEMRINEERMRLEMHHKKKHSPVKAVVSVAAVLVLIGGGVWYKMHSDHQAELAAERADKERIAADARKKEAELEAKLQGIEKNMQRALADAKTEEDRQKIRAAAAEAKATALGKPKPVHTVTKTEPDKPIIPVKTEKRKISDNPLEGLDLDESPSPSSSKKKKH